MLHDFKEQPSLKLIIRYIADNRFSSPEGSGVYNASRGVMLCLIQVYIRVDMNWPVHSYGMPHFPICEFQNSYASLLAFCAVSKYCFFTHHCMWITWSSMFINGLSPLTVFVCDLTGNSSRCLYACICSSSSGAVHQFARRHICLFLYQSSQADSHQIWVRIVYRPHTSTFETGRLWGFWST